jgi:predicted RNase H-like nuclease (RuvC/YqgF family)
LIVAVVASLAAAVVGYVRVGGKIADLNTELTSTKAERDKLQASESKLRRDMRTATENLNKATADLEQTKADLDETRLRATQQQQRADDLEARLNTTTQQREKAQSELARWEALGRSIEQLRAMMADNRRLVEENNALTEENRVLGRKVNVLQVKLDVYEGRKAKVELRADLKGRVVAVDPKYEFVVLDIGETDGVLERGEMLVSRSGKLVAKVRILSVQPNRSIANILPDWKQAEIMEGDAVIVGM